jgi:hypothetical protein
VAGLTLKDTIKLQQRKKVWRNHYSVISNNSKYLIALVVLFLFSEIRPMEARPRKSKSCVQKVLLPGHSKPVKCRKARKIKNAYF